MNCFSQTPCYNNTITYTGCGEGDPCNPAKRLGCDAVVYSGANLPCTGIEVCDTLCVALQKIDDAICNTPGTTVTASNGLYKNLIQNDIRLGGPLTENTIITTTPVITLSLQGLDTDPVPQFILTQNTLGVIRKSTPSSILATLTADNGLTKTGDNIQLGGPLIKPTTITTSGTNTLSLNGLQTDDAETFVIGVDPTTGLLTKRSVDSLVTASNGLTETNNDVQLGGTLIKNTVVDIDSYAITIRDMPSGAGFKIDPAGFAPNTHIKTQVYKPIQFIDAVGINVGPYNNNEKFLNVGKAGVFTNTPTETTTDVYMSMSTAGSETSTTIYASDMNRLVWEVNANQTIRQNTVLAANFAYLQCSSNFTTSTASGDKGSLTASAAQCYFTGSGDTERVTAYRAFPPIKDSVSGFTGNITEAIGVQIDDQRTFDIETSIATTYGVRQLGARDTNHFRGTFQLPSSNTSIGTATLVAGTVTVSTVSAKTGSRIFLSVNTPGGTQGFLSAPSASIVNGVSFVINSTNVADTSTVNWWIINS
jgi:hypothetical protein